MSLAQVSNLSIYLSICLSIRQSLNLIASGGLDSINGIINNSGICSIPTNGNRHSGQSLLSGNAVDGIQFDFDEVTKHFPSPGIYIYLFLLR